jgi:hypothetical protein
VEEMIWIDLAVLVALWAVGFATGLSADTIQVLLLIAAIALMPKLVNRRTESILDNVAPAWRDSRHK